MEKTGRKNRNGKKKKMNISSDRNWGAGGEGLIDGDSITSGVGQCWRRTQVGLRTTSC